MAVSSLVSRGVLNQYIAALAACFSLVVSASTFTWVTPILKYLLSPESEIPLTATELPWIVSLIELGNLLSSIPAGFLCDHFGRKPVMLVSAPIYIVGWLLILYFPTSLVLGIGRTIHGFAMGLAYSAAPVYLGEIAGDATRGSVASFFFNSWWIGIITSYVVGPCLSFRNFTLFTVALNIPFVLLFFWQPESPYYCIMAGNEEKAYKSLKWFRDKTPDELKKELEGIKRSIEEDKRSAGVWDVVSTAVDRKAMCILCVIIVVRLSSGTGSLVVYATQVFGMTPNLSIPADVVTIVFGVVLLIGGCIGSLTTDTLGRRPLLLISCIGSLICQLCTGTYYFLLFNTSVTVSTFSWIAPVLILMYCAICTAGIYPVCAAYSSELFTSNTRGVASGVSSIIVTICSFVLLVIFQPMMDYIGLYANFYFFSVVLLAGTLYFFFSAPETKGKSFAQIRQELCKEITPSTVI